MNGPEPCRCDPPGSGARCTGDCYATAERVRIAELIRGNPILWPASGTCMGIITAYTLADWLLSPEADRHG